MQSQPKSQKDFVRSCQADSKIDMVKQRNWNSQTVLKKKNKAGGLTMPDFKMWYKARVIKCGIGKKIDP